LHRRIDTLVCGIFCSVEWRKRTAKRHVDASNQRNPWRRQNKIIKNSLLDTKRKLTLQNRVR